jgi:CelD/BcsL family acetyltransferase involved in cellulose biosynthesis
MTKAEFTITHYAGQVPPFAEAELDRLYGSLFSSLAHFRVYGGAENASTYLAREGDAIVDLLLFRRHKDTIHVINEWIRLDTQDIQRFTDFAFSAFPQVAAVVFHAVMPDIEGSTRPCQRRLASENYQAALPAGVDAYVASLGSATRKNIKRHKNKLERTFPSFALRTYVRDEVDERDLREIIRFNHARMAIKGRVSKYDEQEVQRLIRLVRERGFVTVATIDGKVCGGAITLRIGDTFVSRVNAHDPAYDEHRLGVICCFLTICECIRAGGRRYDFLWGEYEYKTALLGAHQELHDLVVYRSRWHQVSHADLALKIALGACMLKTKQRLLAAARPAVATDVSVLGKCVNTVRWLHHLPSRMAATVHKRKSTPPRHADAA